MYTGESDGIGINNGTGVYPVEDFDRLLTFFKALGNESRLKIVAILADGDCTVRELAELLDLKEPTVSEHLALLKEAGLVTMRPNGNQRIYSFNAKALHSASRELLNREQFAALAPTSFAAAADHERKVLQTFFENGRLKTIPASRKKLLIVLHWLAEQFEIGRKYPEKEVNAIINQYHEDHATLRRELISINLLKRAKGIYWRPDPDTAPDTAPDHDDPQEPAS